MSEPIPTWCWYCKKEIPARADVCPYCGKPLTDSTKVVRCGKCGSFLLLRNDVCTQCGEPLQKPAEPEAPDMQPPAGAAGGADGSVDWYLVQHEPAVPQAQPAGGRKLHPLIPAAAAVAVIALALIFLLPKLRGAQSEPEPAPGPEPVYCAEGEHVWAEADCTHPRTCTVCGKTEGEPLGHTFVDNVCTVCGAYEKPFAFSDSSSVRQGRTVVFSGTVKNYTGVPVRTLQLRLELYDEEQKMVNHRLAYAFENGSLAPLDSVPWEVRIDDTGIQWKYWRIAAVDFTPVEAEEAPAS